MKTFSSYFRARQHLIAEGATRGGEPVGATYQAFYRPSRTEEGRWAFALVVASPGGGWTTSYWFRSTDGSERAAGFLPFVASMAGDSLSGLAVSA